MAKRNRLIASTGSFPASVSVPSRPPQKTYVRAPSSTPDRKSTRLNSSHSQISYAVFCLKKKKHTRDRSVPREDDARPEHQAGARGLRRRLRPARETVDRRVHREGTGPFPAGDGRGLRGP